MVPVFLLPFAVASALATGSASAGSPTAAPAADAAHPVLDARGAAAQRLLAEILIDADAVDLATASASALRFRVERAGEAHELIVALDGRSRVAHTILRWRPRRAPAIGELSWLGLAIAEHDAVVGAHVDEHGIVSLDLDDGTSVPLTPEAGDDYVGC